MYDIGDAVSQWPETKKGVVVNYYWDEHVDEPMYYIKWADGEITTEYENTLNYYCNPDETTEDLEEESEDRDSNYIQAFSEMYDLVEDGIEFPDARQDVSIRYKLNEEEHEQLVVDYDECERINAMKYRKLI